jgi:aminoglycoside phosphotransferase family enzyme/predicted kinase
MNERKPDRDVTPAAQLVRNLINKGNFGHATTSIELVETHISWVLLTGEYAYKIKKPVDLGFLDFSTLAARYKFCLIELELNRRFAPELYLDVISIGGRADQPKVGAMPALEWAVRMRQFPSDARLDRQIEQGHISTDDMRTFGESLAHLHEQSPIVGDTSFDSINAISKPIEDNFIVLRKHCQKSDLPDRLKLLAKWSTKELSRLSPTIKDRQTAGQIRDCHGDLHLENLVQLDDRIAPFDCIEFDATLRRIDVINEVAFLLMDTLRIKRQDLGYSFLNRYLEISGDYPGIAMLPFYSVYRCLVRAKITTLRQIQTHNTDTQADVVRYIKLAQQIAHPKQKPCLIICCGLSGSGKTHLSQKLLSMLPAIRIRSDIVRKQSHAIGELESSGSAVGTGLYNPQITAQTYAMLAQFSVIALTAGYNVIVDATCLRHIERDLLQTTAKNCAARFAILNCTAEDKILNQRVTARQVKQHDASEADLTVLDWQRANLEPLSADEQRLTLTIDTGQNSSAEEITRGLQNIAL